MNYYSIGFGFAPPALDVKTLEEFKDLIYGEKLVVSVLDKLNVTSKHECGQVDGSIYRYIQTDIEPEALAEQISKLIEGTPIQLVEINQVDPENDSGYYQGSKVPIWKLFSQVPE